MTEGGGGASVKAGSAMTAKPAGSGKIMALAGARAFPPLMVVMFHFSEGHHYSGFRPLDFLATRGYLWVEFSFKAATSKETAKLHSFAVTYRCPQ